MPAPAPTDLVLPDGYTARVPGAEDIDAIVEVVNVYQQAVRGSGGTDVETVTADVVGYGSWTRRQLVVADPEGRLVAWATVHDRAGGRTDVRIAHRPGLPDDVAAKVVAWQAAVGGDIAAARGLESTQVDGLVDESDEEQARWMAAAGFDLTRRWLNMSRPVDPEEELPPLRDGVTVRRVGMHDLEDGTTLPVAEDLHHVHRMLEESFEDHFNSYRESFPEFVQRQREVPGHRWDHWWLAFVSTDEGEQPAGALVSTVLSPDASGALGSYVEYIGVNAHARGRGVAKGLLYTVIADAAERGRNRVGLEVDDDSPTGADGLYRSLGWETSYVTESWHLDVPASS